MTDAIDRAAEVLSRVEKTTGPSWLDRERAQALADAGLLAAPEHDRDVAARALREVADSLLPPLNIELRPDGSEDPEAAQWVGFAHEVDDAIRARADRIEKGETDADA